MEISFHSRPRFRYIMNLAPGPPVYSDIEFTGTKQCWASLGSWESGCITRTPVPGLGLGGSRIYGLEYRGVCYTLDKHILLYISSLSEIPRATPARMPISFEVFSHSRAFLKEHHASS